MKYIYKQKVNLITLKKSIEASTFKSKFLNLHTYGEDVIFETTSDLTSLQKTALDGILSSHDNSNTQTIIKQKILKSMALGQDLMAEFASENKMMGMSDAEMLQISVNLREIQSLLNSGSLGLAKAIWDTLTPIPIILTATRISKYSNLIQKHIDSL